MVLTGIQKPQSAKPFSRDKINFKVHYKTLLSEGLLYLCIHAWHSASILPCPAHPASGNRSSIRLPPGTGFYAMKDY
jgi:hypothetical protein